MGVPLCHSICQNFLQRVLVIIRLEIFLKVLVEMVHFCGVEAAVAGLSERRFGVFVVLEVVDKLTAPFQSGCFALVASQPFDVGWTQFLFM